MYNENEPHSSKTFQNNKKKIVSNDLLVNVIHNGKLARYGYQQIDNTASARKTYFELNKSFLIVGGLGGFAIELSLWMAQRQCKKLLLTSRSGHLDNNKSYCINRIRSLSTRVVVCKLDLILDQQCDACMKVACSIGSVGGVFNLAMVIKDRMFEHQSLEDFELVVNAKLKTTANLDRMNRVLNNRLDFFVVFSSVNSVNGIAGQTNYGFANSSVERICESRRKDGLHGLAIQWGPIADVGYWDYMTPDDGPVAKKFHIYSHQSVKSCLNVLDRLLNGNDSVVASYVKCHNDNDANDGGNEDAKSKMSIIAKLLNINDMSKIKTTSTLAELGVDSLMAINLKNELDKYCIVSLNEVLKLTINDIDKLLNA